jgi:2',3'-cyclic-nucleotide 2'-phosphodiesterase (5'-nucleotidase family)
MSHAGLNADKAFIDTLPAGTVLQGAHDHLSFEMENNGVTYFHGSSWGTKLGILELTRGTDDVANRYRSVEIGVDERDAELADLIQVQMAEHLTSEDTAVLAEIKKDHDLHSSILVATEAIRQAAEGDVAVLGHTTFGAPLSKGAFTKYDMDAFIRFGGGLSAAQVSGETLIGILKRANQFNASTLDERTGDYVHAAELDVDPSRTYRFVTNAWTGINQEAYLGTTDLAFEKIPGLELKAVVGQYLSQNG